MSDLRSSPDKYSLTGHPRWERAGTSATEAKKLLSRRLTECDQGLIALERHQLQTGARSEFVFTTRTGAPLDPANLVKRGFEPTLRRAGLRKIRFHDLRHTYASIMINEGANLKFVSKQLGHSSIQITLDRYSHLIPERHDAAVEQFEALLLADSSAPVAATSHD